MTTSVLVVDGGSRGSALVDLYARSRDVERVMSVPSNDRMAINAGIDVEMFPQLTTTSVREIVALCLDKKGG